MVKRHHNRQYFSQKPKANPKRKYSPLLSLFLVMLVFSVVLVILSKYSLSSPVEIEIATPKAIFSLKGKEGEKQIKIMEQVELDAIDVLDFDFFELHPSKVEIADLTPFQADPSYKLPTGNWKILATTPRSVRVTPIGVKRDNPTIKVERCGKSLALNKKCAGPETPLVLDTIYVQHQSEVTLEVADAGESVISLGVKVSKQKSENILTLSKQAFLYTEYCHLDGISDSSNQSRGGQTTYKMQFADDKTAKIQGKSDSIQYTLTPQAKTEKLFDSESKSECEGCISARPIDFSRQATWEITYLKDVKDEKNAKKISSKPPDVLEFNGDFLIEKIRWDQNRKMINFLLQGDAANVRSKLSPNLSLSMLDYLWESSLWTKLAVIIVPLLSILLSLFPLIQQKTKG